MDNGHILALTGAELDAALKNAQNALPRDGSVAMTGNLFVENVWPSVKIKNTDYNYANRLTAGNGGLDIQCLAEDTGAFRELQIRNPHASGMDYALQFRQYNNANDNQTYNILHTGNKPSGSYTGNGSATERTIATGGIGKCCMVYGGTDEMACVTPIGAFFQADGNVKFTSDVTFDGALHIRNAYIINSASTTYNYQVL